MGKPSFIVGEKVITAFQEQFEETKKLIWRVSVTEPEIKVYYIAQILLIYLLLMIS